MRPDCFRVSCTALDFVCVLLYSLIFPGFSVMQASSAAVTAKCKAKEAAVAAAAAVAGRTARETRRMHGEGSGGGGAGGFRTVALTSWGHGTFGRLKARRQPATPGQCSM